MEQEQMSFDDIVVEEKASASSSFGCCSSYLECSERGKCINPNVEYAKGCIYRTNLEKGNVFYSRKAVGFDNELYSNLIAYYEGLPPDFKIAFRDLLVYFAVKKRLAKSLLALSSPQIRKIAFDCKIFSVATDTLLVCALFDRDILMLKNSVKLNKIHSTVKKPVFVFPENVKDPYIKRRLKIRSWRDFFLNYDEASRNFICSKFEFIYFDHTYSGVLDAVYTALFGTLTLKDYTYTYIVSEQDSLKKVLD